MFLFGQGIAGAIDHIPYSVAVSITVAGFVFLALETSFKNPVCLKSASGLIASCPDASLKATLQRPQQEW